MPSHLLIGQEVDRKLIVSIQEVDKVVCLHEDYMHEP